MKKEAMLKNINQVPFAICGPQKALNFTICYQGAYPNQTILICNAFNRLNKCRKTGNGTAYN